MPLNISMGKVAIILDEMDLWPENYRQLTVTPLLPVLPEHMAPRIETLEVIVETTEGQTYTFYVQTYPAELS